MTVPDDVMARMVAAARKAFSDALKHPTDLAEASVAAAFAAAANEGWVLVEADDVADVLSYLNQNRGDVYLDNIKESHARLCAALDRRVTDSDQADQS